MKKKLVSKADRHYFRQWLKVVVSAFILISQPYYSQIIRTQEAEIFVQNDALLYQEGNSGTRENAGNFSIEKDNDPYLGIQDLSGYKKNRASTDRKDTYKKVTKKIVTAVGNKSLPSYAAKAPFSKESFTNNIGSDKSVIVDEYKFQKKPVIFYKDYSPNIPSLKDSAKYDNHCCWLYREHIHGMSASRAPPQSYNVG